MCLMLCGVAVAEIRVVSICVISYFDGMEKIPKLATKKYSIKIDHETLFRQYNLRTLNLVVKYKKDLEKLLKNKRQNIDNIWSLLSYKYKIRNGLFGMNPPQNKFMN